MTSTIQAIRRRAAFGVLTASLAAVLLGTGTPRTAAEHAELTADEIAWRARAHFPVAATNLRIESVPCLSLLRLQVNLPAVTITDALPLRLRAPPSILENTLSRYVRRE